MKTYFWRNISKRLARSLPPIARLHDEGNALLRTVTTLQSELASYAAEMSALQDQLAHARRELADIASRRQAGFTIDLDYPYTARVRDWERLPGGNLYRQLIAAGSARYRSHLEALLRYKDTFLSIACEEPANEREPYWSNPWLPPLDAICLGGLIARLNPRRYVEVGSGNSTKFVRRMIVDRRLRTRIISIDPHPRAAIDILCDEVIRRPLEDCDLSFFAELGPEDLVFIDDSHRSFQNSDVTVVFTEIIPVLRRGCVYGIHDIFLPDDYPQEWTPRAYNEQYLLMVYLLGGAAGDQIELPVRYIQETPDLLAVLNPIVQAPPLAGALPVGGAFWMTKA